MAVNPGPSSRTRYGTRGAERGEDPGESGDSTENALSGFTTGADAERGKRIADALARAFTATGAPAPDCLVRSGD